MNSLARVTESAASAGDAADGRLVGLAEIAVVSDPAAIETAWRRFEADASGHVFQTFDFVSTWLVHVGSDRAVSPRIVVGRGKCGTVHFLLPFGIRRCMGASVLQWLGDEQADYHAGLYAPHFLARLAGDPQQGRRFVEAVITRLRGEADIVSLTRQPATIAGYANPFATWRAAPHHVRAHSTRLGDDWETYYRAKRNSSSRRHDRLKHKKMEAMGPVTVRDAAKPADTRRVLSALFEQKSRSLAARGVPDVFASENVRRFYEVLALKPYPDGPVHVAAIECNGEIAAANWGLVRGDRYYYVLTSYRAGPAARFSPGRALMRYLMRWSIDRGIGEFDFTVGDEDFKTHWCETTEALSESVVVLGPRGIALATTLRAIQWIKPTVKRSQRLSRLVNRCRRRLAARRG